MFCRNEPDMARQAGTHWTLVIYTISDKYTMFETSTILCWHGCRFVDSVCKRHCANASPPHTEESLSPWADCAVAARHGKMLHKHSRRMRFGLGHNLRAICKCLHQLRECCGLAPLEQPRLLQNKQAGTRGSEVSPLGDIFFMSVLLYKNGNGTGAGSGQDDG